MKRNGTHKPTIEDLVEISGIETLHPGGMALTQRTGEVALLKPGMEVLDVSSGRGTQALYYAQTFAVQVTGVDLSAQMLTTARDRAKVAGLTDKVQFQYGDSQALPFKEGTFDAVINECAVGIPDDSQAVLNEMVRVARPGGMIVVHESTWRSTLTSHEKDALSERYGTTPLEFDEWKAMLEKAGVAGIQWEFEQWSRPEMFWNIRKDRDVSGPFRVLTLAERIRTLVRLIPEYGASGVLTAFQNERCFYKAVLTGKLGYCLFWGHRGT